MEGGCLDTVDCCHRWCLLKDHVIPKSITESKHLLYWRCWRRYPMDGSVQLWLCRGAIRAVCCGACSKYEEDCSCVADHCVCVCRIYFMK